MRFLCRGSRSSTGRLGCIRTTDDLRAFSVFPRRMGQAVDIDSLGVEPRSTSCDIGPRASTQTARILGYEMFSFELFFLVPSLLFSLFPCFVRDKDVRAIWGQMFIVS